MTSLMNIARMTALAGTLSFGACATTGGTVTQDQINTTVAQIQTLTQTACKFVPTFSTVASILATFVGGGPIVATATDIATSICNAVTVKSARRGGAGPTVRGVAIQGKFTR